MNMFNFMSIVQFKENSLQAHVFLFCVAHIFLLCHSYNKVNISAQPNLIPFSDFQMNIKK